LTSCKICAEKDKLIEEKQSRIDAILKGFKDTKTHDRKVEFILGKVILALIVANLILGFLGEEGKKLLIELIINLKDKWF
jgi:hypothetical protein